MSVTVDPMSQDSSLSLEQQVVRLQALLEASRQVHSTIDLMQVLQQTARIAVLELEMEGAMFTEPPVSFGLVPEADDAAAWAKCQRFPLIARDGKTITEMVVVTPEDRALTMYEMDFLEGLVLQTAIAAENAANHKRHLEYARLAQDLDAARAIQQSLIPQVTPKIAGYSLAARSRACYSVGGDYLDMVTEPDGSHLMVVADVAGKGMASALVCTAFRSAFRALAKQSLTLKELAARLGQQHWEEGDEARRRYVTAIFMRLDAETAEIEFVNAGHNPGFLLTPDGKGSFDLKTVVASGTPLGMLPGMRYSAERVSFPPGSRLLLYTDGLTEVFRGSDQSGEEFGEERLGEVFATGLAATAEENLTVIWETLDEFTGGAHQQDDMTAIALYRLGDAAGKASTEETA
jgi:sigma-B regulation protein RsbU (phosphoserine phosphatase)